MITNPLIYWIRKFFFQCGNRWKNFPTYWKQESGLSLYDELLSFRTKGSPFQTKRDAFEIGLCDEQIPSSVLFPMGKCIFRYCGKIIKAETSPILSCSPSNYCKEAQWERDFSIFTLEKRRKVVSFRNCKSFHLVRRSSTRLGCHFSWIDEQKRMKNLVLCIDHLLVCSAEVFKAMYLNIPRNTFDCRESLMVSQVTLKKFISTWISKDSSTSDFNENSAQKLHMRISAAAWVHYEFKP